ncbi:MAG TPA: hypothetical protein VL326_33060 [Kofleriaceae bacterium]|nr:hypothetical protein [Kofleriaceae bacterium]
MRFFKNRPLLALAIVLALVGIASGGAYVVKHTFLSIDPTKSAPEIKHDVETQLAQNGVTANVDVEKSSDNDVKMTIMSTDDKLPEKLRDMGAIVVGDGSGSGDWNDQRRITIDDDEAKLDAAQAQRLTDALTSKPVITALTRGAANIKDVIEDALGEAGFTDVEITITDGGSLVVKVKSPPLPPAAPPAP